MSEHKLPALRAPLTDAQIAEKMATGHSVFSPSAAEMTMTCAESLVINTLADDNPSYEAAEGTMAHTLGEEWLKTGERPDHWIGCTETVNGFDIDIDEEMMEFVADYVDACNEIRAEYEHTFTERQVDISDLTPIKGQGGTLDFGGFRWQHMVINDLKYGKEPVFCFYPEDFDPEQPWLSYNKQLCVYAWGVFLEWDWLYNFQTIEIRISQPRLPAGFTSHTITRQELIDFAAFARERWAISWTVNPGRTPSIKGCRWCAISAKCPANYLFQADITAEQFERWDDDGQIIDVVPTKVYTHKKMAKANDMILDQFSPTPYPNLPKPPELSTRAMEKLLRYRKLMDNFFNAVHNELLTRAISDEEQLRWWKLVLGRTRRKWVDDEEHIVDYLVAKGMKSRWLYKTVMLSPAEMERQLHTKLKMSLADAKRLMQEAGLTVQPPGQKTLALSSDARKQLPKDTDVFQNWDESDNI